MQSELRARLVAGPIMGAIFIGALVLDFLTHRHFGIWGFTSICITGAASELRQINRHRGADFPLLPLICGCIALGSLPFVHDFAWYHEAEWLHNLDIGIIIFFSIVAAAITHMRRHGYQQFIAMINATAFGLIYLGFFATSLIALGCIEAPLNANAGTQFVLLTVFTVKWGDITAYFGGRLIGGAKMAPSVSPGKTWAGFACSFVGAIGGTYLGIACITAFGPESAFTAWWQPLLWGVILGPIGVLGDLVESCLKRDSEIKDSGSIIPGFGGFLDVFDAPILAAPLALFLATLFIA